MPIQVTESEAAMARKTNYKFEKMERERRKAEKKAAKAEAKRVAAEGRRDPEDDAVEGSPASGEDDAATAERSDEG